MATFVHLTSENNLKHILRNGLTRRNKRNPNPSGIYAMPVTRNFYTSHQWLRELKRKKPGAPFVGIYFRIPDDEIVWLGKYNRAHEQMTAVEANARITACANPEGYEILIPRKIDKNEIQRVRHLPQVLGWRYYPDSHGKKPCGCRYCQRGEYGGRKLRDE